MKLWLFGILLCILLLTGCDDPVPGTTLVPSHPEDSVTTIPKKEYGYASEQVQAELVYYGGTLYVCSGNVTTRELPTGYGFLTVVQSEDSYRVPDTDYAAAHLPVGTELYANMEDSKYLYVKKEGSYTYYRFIDAQYISPWWG
jgi:hypothetical protein